MALLVIVTGLVLGVSRMEWVVLLLCIAVVISLEMLNSSIERICNMYTTDFHPAIKIIKDLAAAAVLWSALMSLMIGLIIFVPRLLAFFA